MPVKGNRFGWFFGVLFPTTIVSHLVVPVAWPYIVPQIDTSMNNDGDSFITLWRSEEGIILITAPAVSMTAISSRCFGNTWKTVGAGQIEGNSLRR